jgi:hypothetical protein
MYSGIGKPTARSVTSVKRVEDASAHHDRSKNGQADNDVADL